MNRALQESGKDQDDLTSANFASPPNPRMYNRFKNWVNESLSQLLMARDEWEFKTGRAVVDIYPAVYVENGHHHAGQAHGHGDDIDGATITGQDSGFEATVFSTVTHSGSWAAATAKATIYLSAVDGAHFILGESFDETSPDPELNVCSAAGWGRYYFNLDGQVADLLEVLRDTVMLQPTDEQAGLKKLNYVDWDNWTDTISTYIDPWGEPDIYTIAPDGGLEVYPRPDTRYTLVFDYTKTETAMVAFDDTPDPLPERYHMAIVWAAVEKSGMYDRDRAIVARAQRELRFYRDRLERHHMPDISFGESTL